MRNYKLDNSLLPEVWLTWENKSGIVYMNGKNGKRQTNPEPWMRTSRLHWGEPDDGKTPCGLFYETVNKGRIWVQSGSMLVYAYAKYHADIQRLEVAAVKYDTTRGEHKHEWKYAGCRYFIGKDKTCLLEDGTLYTDGWKDLFFRHSAYNLRYALRTIANMHSNSNMVNEFKKFIGADYFLIGNGSSIVIDKIWNISKWYESVQKARGKGKQQLLTDKLTAIALSDKSEFVHKYPIRQSTSSQDSYYAMRDIVYCERVNDDWAVLRSFKRDSYSDTLTEEWRMYLCKDGTTRIASPSEEGWIPSTQKRGWRYNFGYLANKEEAMEICPRIKYILSSAKVQHDYEEMHFLTIALRFPEIEQMCKFGCHNGARSIANSSTPKAELKHLFGGYYNDKEKNLLRKIGMTKQQLDVYSSLNGELEDRGYIHSEWTTALCTMREMFGNDLTYLDIDSFAKHLRACHKFRAFRRQWDNAYIMDRFGMDIDKVRFYKNLVRLMGKREDIFTLVYDAMNAYTALRNDRRFNVDWYFDDVSDAVRIHDALVELRNQQYEEDRARYDMEASERIKKEEEKRKKLDKERKVYEYEDDEFIIRLPKDANEIVYEGTSQHICIGSYASRHSIGDTNLFFLRRKYAPDVPFYAIEMSNSYVITQIHGFGNRWLGNNPEAIPTVVRWLRKHGIKCDQEILTCNATGYGKTRTFVQMPVID